MENTTPSSLPTQTVFKHVLLVLDGLDTSMAAATLALSMARELGSALTALFVVDTPTLDFLVQQHVLHLEERNEMEKDLEASAEHYLHFLTETGRDNGVEIACLVRKGRLSQIALQLARELAVSAAVIGGPPSCSRHDPSSTERQLLLTECACPIILVRK